MDYVGKTCPYCKTKFKEDDEVVLCSVCEMPHHKDCWIENAACTTFGCTGTMVGVGEEIPQPAENNCCTSCGHPLEEGQKFCSACGAVCIAAPVQQQSASNYNAYSNTYGNMNYGQASVTNMSAEMAEFIKTEQQGYANRFQKMASANTKTSWNWASCAGSAWLGYRKMYPWGVLALIAELLVATIPSLGVFLLLAAHVLFGVFGDYIYKRNVEEQLETIKDADENTRSSFIAKNGGTSTEAATVLAVVKGIVLLIMIA